VLLLLFEAHTCGTPIRHCHSLPSLPAVCLPQTIVWSAQQGGTMAGRGLRCLPFNFFPSCPLFSYCVSLASHKCYPPVVEPCGGHSREGSRGLMCYPQSPSSPSLCYGLTCMSAIATRCPFRLIVTGCTAHPFHSGCHQPAIHRSRGVLRPW
jgi:hypothetical protein